MPEAVKPATDNTAKPAVETDAAKKEKAAADGAHEKLAKEAADATKPGEVKKPEDAAKKPEEVAKKPEDAAKATTEKSWIDMALDEVRNSSVASWMGIKSPDKSHPVPKVEVAAKAKPETAAFLDLGAPIAGYDGKKTEARLEVPKADPAKAAEPAKDGGGLWGWIGDKTSEAGKWIKDTFWAEKAEKADKVLDSFSEIKLDSASYQYKAIEKEDGLYEFLTKKNDGDVCKISDTSCTRTFDKIQTTYDRKTKSSEIVDTETNRKFNRLESGEEVITNPDGSKYGRRPDGTYFSVVNDQIAEIRGDADKKEISQRLDELERLYHRGQRVDLQRPGMLPFHGKHNRVDTGENFDLTASPDGKVTFGRVDNKQVAILEDKSSYIFDPRTKQAIHVDANGKILERGTAEDMAKKVPGLIMLPNGRLTMEGSSAVFKTDAVTGQTTTEQTAVSGKKIVSTSPGPDGVENTKFIGADGKVISQSDINHNDPEHLFVQKDAEGKVLTNYNVNSNTYESADNSFKFTNNGVELFGGKVYVDHASGDVSYSDGVRLTNSSPGAVQASEAAAVSASANASSVASALSAKAGNPATVSAGDLSACYGAYGNIVAAMNACLTSGNFAGFAQCMAAKGALESAIGVIAPKLAAMDDASKAGLSGYALNEVGQKTGGSTNYKAIEEVIARQNGVSRPA